MLVGDMKNSAIKLDAAQKELLSLLESYSLKLEEHLNDKGFFAKLFSKPQQVKAGIYVYGNVGRGKSMLMDMFFEKLRIKHKQREHFHQFMLDCHQKLHQMREQEEGEKGDDVVRLAKQIANEVDVLCFDELQVNNIADAMIVGRLFETLMQEGVFIIFTSNRAPSELFKDGLQRDRFLPFIKLIETKTEVFELKSETDYRLSKISSIDKRYLYPLNQETKKLLNDAINLFTEGKQLDDTVIQVDQNRHLHVLRSYGNFAIFTFNELCQSPLSAMDYIAIAKRFSTIIIENLPQLNTDHHNEALRFITLIDCFYEYHTKLICTAEVAIERLYASGKNQFEFARTISRLKEMASKEYVNDEAITVIASNS